ncbi:hypothetical protein SNEBB_000806 [Seison nebaliae]|nr:hypothetical protein SNEBB_000806 [Seison nebaliae]
MWNIILTRVISRYIPIISLPVAVVLGTTGYFVEKMIRGGESGYEQAPVYEESIIDVREKRLLQTEDKDAWKFEASETIFNKNRTKDAMPTSSNRKRDE